jgi:predicted PurR-regulated permease PerM
MKRTFIFGVIFILFILMGNQVVIAGEGGFTQEDRERLIRLEATLQTFMEQTNKRFEDMNKRFEQVDKRFEELRDDMNKRFEQVDKRFEQLYTFLWIITGIFTTLTLGVIGFAYWDRRTIIRKAREESVEEVERRFNLSVVMKFIEALRELAREDEKVARVLRQFNLL